MSGSYLTAARRAADLDALGKRLFEIAPTLAKLCNI
jgi:hypothetical protein